MAEAPNLIASWWFQAPNMLLAALMYTLLGRFILGLFFGTDSDKTIIVVFSRITDPVLNAVRAITPLIVHEGLLLIFAFVWLLGLRVALLLIFLLLRSPAGGA